MKDITKKLIPLKREYKPMNIITKEKALGLLEKIINEEDVIDYESTKLP